ncbi:hypothetical protein, partial [Stenotrophomonas muris]|uniref:hypothetical protein n=1 Tax=Stenotrophomonas muris TaxID=2963283 RepID=UPI00300EC331
ADAGMRGGKLIPYKPMVDAACAEATSPPPHVLIVSRGLDAAETRFHSRACSPGATGAIASPSRNIRPPT